MAIKTAAELAYKVRDIAQNCKTVYVYGAFGQPVTEELIKQKEAQYAWFYTTARKAKIAKTYGKGYWGFDCVNLIKGVLWGWSADDKANHGGAKYASNGVPDINADTMIARCKNVSTNFSTIEIGEVVWTDQHIGVYIGEGLAVECTPSWKNCVQITAVKNIGTKAGYNARAWKKHGKLPYVSYPQTGSATKLKKPYSGQFPTLPAKGYLGQGDRGTQVKNLQRFLNWYGNYGLTLDGSYGPATEQAVERFQKAACIAVDGYFGPGSLRAAKAAKK